MTQPPGRLGSIIKIIARMPGITLSQLLIELKGEGFSITERTLAKDILSLKHDYGLLPKKDRLRHGYVLDGICSLSNAELILVLDAMHVFGHRLSAPEAEALAARIQELLKNERNETVAHQLLSRTIGLRNIYKKSKSMEQIERTLLEAIRTQMPVRFTYHTPRIGKPEQFEAYPLMMIFHERGWYCIMKDRQKDSYQPRRLDRIRECSIISRAEPNKNRRENVLEAQYLISCGWGMSFPRSMKELKEAEIEAEIIVRFDRTIAPYILESIERHPRAKISPLKDGSGDVEFRIRLSNPIEFQFWVRSFGSKAWFVAPRSLVEAEKAELRRIEQRYRIQ